MDVFYYKPGRSQRMPPKKQSRLLLLDYDGTVVPLQRQIDRSFMPTPTRGMLKRLARRHRVIFVTGRDLADLTRLAGPLKGIGKVGTHGIEVEDIPRLHLAPKERLRRFMKDRRVLVAALRKEFTQDKTVFLQVKKYALSLHYPHQGAEERQLRIRFRRVVRRYATPGLWVFQTGKQMIDLRPKGHSKAAAVRALLKMHPDHAPLFAGDDLSDLPAFRALQGKGVRVGIGHVIQRKDCDLWFATPQAFVKWLGQL
jgi:trehalose 6-phosphate phosphatase